MPSLSLCLSVDGSAVLLQADGLHRDALRRLTVAFPEAQLRSALTVEIGLDEFLRNLAALADWPSGDVDWASNLKNLVEDSLRDTRAAQSALMAPTTGVSFYGGETPALGALWNAPLMGFQTRDLSKLLALRHGANFSVPGAGKTRVALAVYSAERHAGRVNRLLVVCPKSAFESWEVENVEVFATDPLLTARFEGVVDAAAELLLVNYERLPAARSALARWIASSPTMMILDEAHRMKLGAAGAYGGVCLSLGPIARRRLILTGTPAPNGVEDLKNLMAFVWPGSGRRVVTQAVGHGDLRAASSVLRPFFTRTTKEELGLPPVERSVRRVDLPPLHREIYSALLGQMSGAAARAQGDIQAVGHIVMYLLMAADSPAFLATGTTRYEPLAYRVPPLEVPPDATLAELLQDLPAYEFSPKYREVLAIVAANAAVGRKTLVWSTFVRSLTTLREMLLQFQPALVHGGSVDRSEELYRFRADPECLVLLSNPATLGEGVSLHHVCHDAVFVDRDFAAGRYLQSLDRIHRLGLAEGERTKITVLVAKDTIDEVVELRLGAKLRFMGAILDDKDVEVMGDLDEEPSVGGGLSLADLTSIMAHLHASSP